MNDFLLGPQEIRFLRKALLLMMDPIVVLIPTDPLKHKLVKAG